MSVEIELERYLHDRIPLSAAMRVGVREARPETVVLHAPLAPNINHKSTMFGGSASALAILSAWSLVHVRLTAEDLPGEIVIQSNRMDYDRPVTGACTAASSVPEGAAWPAFVATLRRRGRARIEVHATLAQAGMVCGRFSGRFVALRDRAA